MSEALMRKKLVKNLMRLDAVPIENMLRAGTPDVNFLYGWIECKYMKFWPRNAEKNPVRFPHPLTKEQCLWIKRRCKRGGLCYVAIQVSRDWFFFKGTAITDLFNNMTKPQMIEKCDLYMKSGLDKEELIKWLTN